MYRISASFLLGALLLGSCQKEQFQLDKLSDEVEIQTDLLAPLIYGSMGMGEIVAEFDSSGYVGEFGDGLIYLTYADTLVDVMVDSLDLLIDGLYTEIYYDTEISGDPAFIGSTVGDTIHFLKSKYYGFETEGDSRLDSIVFKGGELLTEMESTFMHTGFLTISSPYIRDPLGDFYSYTMVISDLSGSFSWAVSESLDGYFLEAEQQGDSSVFRMDYDFALINSGNPIDPGDYCEVRSSFLDMGFYELYGYLDPDELVRESGVLDVPVYADFPELSNLKVADPRIKISTENSLGIPFELTLDSVLATAEDASTAELEIYQGQPFIIPAPGINSMGETAFGEFYINNQSSNLQDLLNIAPHTLSYRVTGDVGSQSQSHFLLDTSKFMAEVEFLLPLDLSITEFSLSDTLEFNIGEDGIDTTLIKHVTINLSTLNELPLELGVQVYMLDASSLVIDSLFKESPVLLSSSQVDNEGKLVQASQDSHSFDFPSEKLGILVETEYLWMKAQLVTAESGEPFVKFYSDYSLDFEISFYAELRINTREL
jgi:hypothetical protein